MESLNLEITSFNKTEKTQEHALISGTQRSHSLIKKILKNTIYFIVYHVTNNELNSSFLYVKNKIKSPMWKLKIKCTILESIFANVPKQSNK